MASGRVILKIHFIGVLFCILCKKLFEIWALSTLLEHMHKKFEINQTKIKGSCQSERKIVTHDSKSDLPLKITKIWDRGTNMGQIDM